MEGLSVKLLRALRIGMQALVVAIALFGLGCSTLMAPNHSAMVWAAPTYAPADLSRQPTTEVTVDLGTAANELKFSPDHLSFSAGKRYTLVLKNPSTLKHYFTAKDFADVIWTQKVEAGKVEIKGAISELELKPGAEAEWMFVPIKSGTYELHCSVPGHTEAGMTGTISVTVK